uniref:Uncharacterized protein n=1 Tax=Knipowitschia caucasica TaxID=637954 RepID=A0AAV2JCQ8_KNICA
MLDKLRWDIKMRERAIAELERATQEEVNEKKEDSWSNLSEIYRNHLSEVSQLNVKIKQLREAIKAEGAETVEGTGTDVAELGTQTDVEFIDKGTQKEAGTQTEIGFVEIGTQTDVASAERGTQTDPALSETLSENHPDGDGTQGLPTSVHLQEHENSHSQGTP